MHEPAVATTKTKIKTELGFVIIEKTHSSDTIFFNIEAKTKAKGNGDRRNSREFLRFQTLIN